MVGKRKTFRWVLCPVPTNYADIDVLHSVRPTPTTSRRHHNRTTLPFQLNEFRTKDATQSFSDINDSIFGLGYKLEVHEENREAIFYKMENNMLHIPTLYTSYRQETFRLISERLRLSIEPEVNPAKHSVVAQELH